MGCRCPIPAKIGLFQGGVLPVHARIRIADDDPLTPEAQGPDSVGAHLAHIPLHTLGATRIQIGYFEGARIAPNPRLKEY